MQATGTIQTNNTSRQILAPATSKAAAAYVRANKVDTARENVKSRHYDMEARTSSTGALVPITWVHTKHIRLAHSGS